MTDTDRQKQPASRTARRTTTPRVGPSRVGLGVGVGLSVLALVGGLVACGGTSDKAAGGESPSAAPSAGPSVTETELPEVTPSARPTDLRQISCQYRKDDTGSPAKIVGYPPKRLTRSVIKATQMTLRTNLGDIVIDVSAEATPCALNSFAFLAEKNFFDNTVCHRLTTMESNGLGLLQCGDPQAKGDGKNPTDGTGGPGYLFDDENIGVPLARGTVFLAQSPDAVNANGSQFVFSYTDENGQLPADYTVFGVVSKGLDIIDKVAKGGVIVFPDGGDITNEDGGSNAPKTRVLIKDLTVS
ncbi:peptidylprolyl isomerase [Sphaerimonospora cavernae]|uniref:Peptidylprolyl isomerase n=1 Tax=Sphaerimonospora cavernae TaxID=1740611 RepID=A0ABV6U627_9ACTN